MKTATLTDNETWTVIENSEWTPETAADEYRYQILNPDGEKVEEYDDLTTAKELAAWLTQDHQETKRERLAEMITECEDADVLRQIEALLTGRAR